MPQTTKSTGAGEVGLFRRRETSGKAMRLALIPAMALAGLLYISAAHVAVAAPMQTPSAAVTVAPPSHVTESAYYYHGRSYPYRYRGMYYRHRYYRYNRWHYY
jgi:hypothetical protein